MVMVPAGLRGKQPLRAEFDDAEAMAFGLWKGKAYLSFVHHTIIQDNPELKDSGIRGGQERNKMDYSGRIWKGRTKLISFWEYPKGSKFNDVIDALARAIKKPITDDWLVEIKVGRGYKVMTIGEFRKNKGVEKEIVDYSESERMANHKSPVKFLKPDPHPIDIPKDWTMAQYHGTVYQEDMSKVEELPFKTYIRYSGGEGFIVDMNARGEYIVNMKRSARAGDRNSVSVFPSEIMAVWNKKANDWENV